MHTPVTAVTAALAAALSFTLPAHAAKDADLAEIRAQVKQMKEAYEQRITALESRLAEAEKTYKELISSRDTAMRVAEILLKKGAKNDAIEVLTVWASAKNDADGHKLLAEALRDPGVS